VELQHPDGISGWGECVAGEQPNYSAETIDTAWWAIRTWIAPRLREQELPSPNAVHDLLARDFRGHQMAKASVEMATWELAARLDGVPLARKLGGTREEIPTGISLGIQNTPEALVELAVRARAQGYRKIR